MRNMVILTMLKPIVKVKLIPCREILRARYYTYLAFCDMGYSVDNTFKSVVHAIALNENRYQFTQRFIFGSQTNNNYQDNRASAENFESFRLEKDS